MERLTRMGVNGVYGLAKVKDNEQDVESPHPNTLKAIFESFQQLGAYENSNLMPAEITAMQAENKRLTAENQLLSARLDEYRQAEQDGRLVRVPCKVGDTIYWVWCDGEEKPDGDIVAEKVLYFYFDKHGVGIATKWIDGRIGHFEKDGAIVERCRRIFLTEDSARASLQEGG